MIDTDGFYTNQKDGSVYLKREAMKKYFVEYENFFCHEFSHPDTGENITLRKCFRLQAERLAGAIKGAGTYVPFTLKA